MRQEILCSLKLGKTLKYDQQKLQYCLDCPPIGKTKSPLYVLVPRSETPLLRRYSRLLRFFFFLCHCCFSFGLPFFALGSAVAAECLCRECVWLGGMLVPEYVAVCRPELHVAREFTVFVVVLRFINDYRPVLLGDQDDHTYLFVTESGVPRKEVSYLLRSVQMLYLAKAAPGHSLRHSQASLSARVGISPEENKAMAASRQHSVHCSESVYTKANRKRQAELAEKHLTRVRNETNQNKRARGTLDRDVHSESSSVSVNESKEEQEQSEANEAPDAGESKRQEPQRRRRVKAEPRSDFKDPAAGAAAKTSDVDETMSHGSPAPAVKEEAFIKQEPELVGQCFRC